MISLYRAYVILYIESVLLPVTAGNIQVFKTNTIELANHHAIKSLLNLSNSVTTALCLATMDTHEQRRSFYFLSVLDWMAQIIFLSFLHLG